MGRAIFIDRTRSFRVLLIGSPAKLPLNTPKMTRTMKTRTMKTMKTEMMTTKRKKLQCRESAIMGPLLKR